MLHQADRRPLAVCACHVARGAGRGGTHGSCDAAGRRGGRPSPSGLADVIDTIPDKGLVIDAYIRVSLVGVEVLTSDARIVVASVDTYLRFAEAVSRLDISSDKQGLPELVSGSKQSTATRATKGILQSVGDKIRDLAEPEPQRAPRRPR